jgi:hypothetical protein
MPGGGGGAEGRNDPLSPLQLPHVCAAKTTKPGDPITIDNIQLGMVS